MSAAIRRFWLQNPQSFHEELYRAFQPWFSGRDPLSQRSAGVFPPINLSDDGTNYLVTAEVPGADKASLEVTVLGDQLTIKGSRKVEVANASYHRRERDSGSFQRTLTLPEAVDAERIRASYEEGVLRVELPRLPAAQPKKIQIH